MTRKQIFDELYDKYLYMTSKEHKQAIYTDMKPLFRQSRRYLLRFWHITVGALLCQSRSHVPQARASRLFLALLASNAPKLPCTRGRGISVRDKANERSCSLCSTASEFNAVSGGKTRPSGGANMLATA